MPRSKLGSRVSLKHKDDHLFAEDLNEICSSCPSCGRGLTAKQSHRKAKGVHGMLCTVCEKIKKRRSAWTGQMIGIILLNQSEKHPKMLKYGKTFLYKLQAYKDAGWEVILHGIDKQQPWWRWGDWGTRPLKLKQIEDINPVTPTIARLDGLRRRIPFPKELTKKYDLNELLYWCRARDTAEGKSLKKSVEYDPSTEFKKELKKRFEEKKDEESVDVSFAPMSSNPSSQA
jgi:hypothetical protein